MKNKTILIQTIIIAQFEIDVKIKVLIYFII